MRRRAQIGRLKSAITPFSSVLIFLCKLHMAMVALFALLLASPLILAQDSTASENDNQATVSEQTAAQESAGEPYEIIVNPTLRIGDLRKLIFAAEDNMFAKYNELNLDDDFDILCERRAPTGSHISRRTCEPVFLSKARAENHSFFVFMMTRGGGGPELMSEPALTKILFREYEELQHRMEGLTATDPEFRTLTQRVLDLRTAIKER